MSTEYYIILNERQAGPFSKDDLRMRHLSPYSLVWRIGLPDWVEANSLPELSDLFLKETPYEDLSNQPRAEQSRWFAMINDAQVGPYTPEELLARGLTPSTPVWRNGMNDWSEAYTQPELREIFQATPPPHHQQTSDFGRQTFGNTQYQNSWSSPRHNSYQHQNNRNPYIPDTRTNWLPWAITATITGFFFSCIGVIFGIIAIINANKANGLYAAGYDDMGHQANETAKIMTIIGFVLAGIGLVASGIIYKTSILPGLF